MRLDSNKRRRFSLYKKNEVIGNMSVEDSKLMIDLSFGRYGRHYLDLTDSEKEQVSYDFSRAKRRKRQKEKVDILKQDKVLNEQGYCSHNES